MHIGNHQADTNSASSQPSLLPPSLNKSRIIILLIIFVLTIVYSGHFFDIIENILPIKISLLVRRIAFFVALILLLSEIIATLIDTFYKRIYKSLKTKADSEASKRIQKTIDEETKKLKEEFEQAKKTFKDDWENRRRDELSQAKSEALKNKPALYEPLIQSCEDLVKHMIDIGMEPLAFKMISKFSEQPLNWKDIINRANPGVEDKNLWSMILDAAMLEYFDALADVRLGKTGDPVLPSNFLVYARCVGKILQAIDYYIEHQTEDTHVTISTMLGPPITRWFNLIHISSGDFWCTQDWWEKYKSQIKSYRLKSQNSGKKKITIGRLVAIKRGIATPKSDVTDPRALLIRDGGTIDQWPKSIEELVRQSQAYYNEERVKLIEGSIPQLELNAVKGLGFGTFPAYAIGVSSNAKSSSPWYSLIEIFQDEYHDGSLTDFSFGSKGVYYHYCDLDEVRGKGFKYMDYDDLFLVEVKQRKKKNVASFGLGYKIEEARDTSGMNLLMPVEVEEAIEQFRHVWNTDGKASIEEVIKNER